MLGHGVGALLWGHTTRLLDRLADRLTRGGCTEERLMAALV
jgi:hypothetical protein